MFAQNSVSWQMS